MVRGYKPLSFKYFCKLWNKNTDPGSQIVKRRNKKNNFILYEKKYTYVRNDIKYDNWQFKYPIISQWLSVFSIFQSHILHCRRRYIENTMLVSDIIKFIRQGLEKNESEALPRFPFFRAEPDKFYNIRHLFGILFIMFTFFYLFFSSICLFLSFCLENARGIVTSI